MSKSRQNRSIPGVSACIFCGDPDLTDEHILPKWLRKMYPVTVGGENHRIDLRDDDRLPFETHTGYLSESRGSMKRKLPCACAGCNNGWMSRLQTDARPVIERLVQFPFCALTVQERTLFSRWAVMTGMVFEFASPKFIATQQFQRTYFAQAQTFMPERWAVAVGRYDGVEDSVGAFSCAIAMDGSPESKKKDIFWRVHRSTFHVGKLLWHTVGLNRFTIVDDLFRIGFEGLGLRMVWPSEHFPLSALSVVRGYQDIRALQLADLP